MKKIVLFFSVAALLSGCASVAVTEDTLQSRTALALNLQPGDFAISNRTDSGLRTDYTVKTKSNATYACYVMGTVSYVGRAVSDPMCTQTSAAPGKAKAATAQPVKATCNELLKAAKKC